MKIYLLTLSAMVLINSIMGQEVKTIMLPNDVPMHFIYVQKGTFIMGSDSTESGRQKDEGPQRQVTLTQDFFIGQYEVTQLQYETIMGENPSVFNIRGSLGAHPVEMVSWEDAQRFIEKLNAVGLGSFRLPTEAEWEYACRAGTSSRYSFGDDPDYKMLIKYAWYNSRSEGKSHPVGEKLPNDWGIYDMHGNVWEWCEDGYGEYKAGLREDPAGPDGDTGKIIRGGSWFNEPEALRSANRHRHPVDSRQTNLGLRLILKLQ